MCLRAVKALHRIPCVSHLVILLSQVVFVRASPQALAPPGTGVALGRPSGTFHSLAQPRKDPLEEPSGRAADHGQHSPHRPAEAGSAPWDCVGLAVGPLLRGLVCGLQAPRSLPLRASLRARPRQCPQVDSGEMADQERASSCEPSVSRVNLGP